MAEYIPGGYILLSRKLLKSGIMEKPHLYLKLWTWMLMQAFYKGHGDLQRGQFFTSIPKMQKAMAYKVGYRTVSPTKREIQGVTKYLMKNRMIVTMKVLHGTVVTILNYEQYQDMKNYEGYNEGANDVSNDVPILRKKVLKKEKTPDFSSLKKRYPDPELIEQAFEAIASTRKSKRVAESVLFAQLQKWEKYPVGQVEAGIQVYLDKGCAAEGKREEYLYGIIRKQNSKPKLTPKSNTPAWL